MYSNGDLVSSDGRINPNIKGRTVSLLAWEADAALSQPNGLILDSFAELLAKMGYLGPYMPLSTLDQIHKRNESMAHCQAPAFAGAGSGGNVGL